MSFFERLRAENLASGHQVCAGIDLHIAADPWQAHVKHWGLEELLARGACAMVDACFPYIKVFKVQMAFFEAHGLAGYAALKQLCNHIRARGGLLILDAKRARYFIYHARLCAKAFDYFKADCLTVLPYMGISTLDAVKPWLNQCGVYIVWVSSNLDGQRWQEPIQSDVLTQCLQWKEQHQILPVLVLYSVRLKVGELAGNRLEVD